MITDTDRRKAYEKSNLTARDPDRTSCAIPELLDPNETLSLQFVNATTPTIIYSRSKRAIRQHASRYARRAKTHF